MAHAEGRIVITRGKDFGTLAVHERKPHCGIVRLVGLPATRELAICQNVLEGKQSDLRHGSLVTVELHRIRLRRPEV